MSKERKKIEKRLDDLARKICHKRGHCECGEHCGNPPNKVLQWAHICGRTARATRWRDDNCFLLCKGCHCYFTYHNDDFALWVITKIGVEKYAELKGLAKTNKHFTIEELLALENQLKKEAM